MNNLKFHNTTVDINHMWYRSHKELIRLVAREMGDVEKTDELVEKFLGSETKFKKHKDPNAPKRPKTGFLFFCDEMRSEVKKTTPSLQMCGVMKELGKMWGTYSDEQKEQFNSQSRNARSEYEEKIEEYNINHY